MAAKGKPSNPPQDPPDDGGDDDAVEFTPKQLEMISNTVNAAVTAHVKRHMKPLQDQLSALPSIQETLEKLAGGADKGAQDPAGGGKGAPAAPAKIEEHPQFIAQQRRLAPIEQEREQERTQAHHARRDAALVEIATKAGVDKNRLRGAVALLRDQVKFDKEGNPLMSVKRHGIDEDVTIEEGAGEFFKTDEGKAYLAPTQAAPRGGSGGGRGTSAAGVVNRAPNNAPARGATEAKTERKQAAAEAFVGAVGELFAGGNINVGGG